MQALVLNLFICLFKNRFFQCVQYQIYLSVNRSRTWTKTQHRIKHGGH